MEIKPYKRINFFSGFLTTADDWNAAEAYHNEKRKLHNSYLHTPGIIPDYLDGLKVEATKDEKHVSVGAGCAIDPQGRELLLPKPSIVSIEPEGLEPGQTIFVVLRYHEETQLKEYYQQNVNPDYEGYKFVKESPIIDIDGSEPRPADGVELARIKLGDSGRISDEDINTRYVRVAGPRVSLRNSFEQIKDSTSSLHKGKLEPVPIERVPLDQPKGVYFVNAYPSKGPGPVSWKIEAVIEDDEISYELHITVQGETTKEVAYQVYKLM